MKLSQGVKLPNPADTQVAEHRYLRAGSVDELERELLASERGTEARRRFLALVPYKAGEVVYISNMPAVAQKHTSAPCCAIMINMATDRKFTGCIGLPPTASGFPKAGATHTPASSSVGTASPVWPLKYLNEKKENER